MVKFKNTLNHHLKSEGELTHKAVAYILNNTSPDISRMFNAAQLFQNKKQCDREKPTLLPTTLNPKTSAK